jgi:hypothetical protein
MDPTAVLDTGGREKYLLLARYGIPNSFSSLQSSHCTDWAIPTPEPKWLQIKLQSIFILKLKYQYCIA